MKGLPIKKGDVVKVITGKEKDKTGKVLKSLPAKQRVVVEGLHMNKRALRPTQKNPQGGYISKEGSIHVSNVMLVCSSCDESVRFGHRESEEGANIRVCRGCGADIDKG